MIKILEWSTLFPIVVLFAILLALCEFGFKQGQRLQDRTEDTVTAGIEPIIGPFLTLLALLLAFSVSFAESHYARRKQLAVDEANAIGTTLLRTQFLAQPDQEAMAALLLEYAKTRGTFYEYLAAQKSTRDTVELTKAIQTELWQHAAKLGKKYPGFITTGLMVDSLNLVFDIEENQRIELTNTIPISIIMLLVFASTVAMGMIGFQLGVLRSRHWVWTSLLALVLASTLYVILDLDKSQKGFIRIQNESLSRLYQKPPGS
ncbi:MAG TPA: hypothetical protein VFO10_11845 [Oligoflexus sp.]|uniref:bestrophin-like domain n=1 Tax=Oligoflexus sp. TaxID=1971216 RepID=UPI002D808BA2|nr:hypothetical protein [Oligoflexus sp.]HET9237940.1 hypothetical protein [Oligoflexus sp.]